MYYSLIENYISTMNKDDVNNFALKNDIHLSEKELDYLYNFIKNNYSTLLKNPNEFNIDNYNQYFEEDNFIKIKKVFQEYFSKYHKFL